MLHHRTGSSCDQSHQHYPSQHQTVSSTLHKKLKGDNPRLVTSASAPSTASTPHIAPQPLTIWIRNCCNFDKLYHLCTKYANSLNSIHICAAFSRLVHIAHSTSTAACSPDTSVRKVSNKSARHENATRSKKSQQQSPAAAGTPAAQHGSHCADFAALLAHHPNLELNQLRSREISNLLWGAAKLNLPELQTWSMDLTCRLQDIAVERLNSQDISNSLWAIASLGLLPDAAWLSKVLRHWTGLPTHHQHEANILWALARLDPVIGSDILSQLQRRAFHEMPNMSGQEVANTLHSLAALSAQLHPEQLVVLDASMRVVGSRLSPQAAANACYALARLRGRPLEKHASSTDPRGSSSTDPRGSSIGLDGGGVDGDGGTEGVEESGRGSGRSHRMTVTDVSGTRQGSAAGGREGSAWGGSGEEDDSISYGAGGWRQQGFSGVGSDDVEAGSPSHSHRVSIDDVESSSPSHSQRVCGDDEERLWASCVGMLSKAAVRQLHGMRSQELANMMWGLAKLGWAPDREWMRTFYAASSMKLPACNAQDLVQLLWSVAKLGCRPPSSWTSSLVSALHPHLHSLNPQQLSNITCALVHLHHTPPSGWSLNLLVAVRRKLSSFTVQGLANLAWGTSQPCLHSLQGLLPDILVAARRRAVEALAADASRTSEHSGAAKNQWKVHPQYVPVEALAADAGTAPEHSVTANDQRKVHPQSVSVEALAAVASRTSEYSSAAKNQWAVHPQSVSVEALAADAGAAPEHRGVADKHSGVADKHSGAADNQWKVHPQSVPVEALAADAGTTSEHSGVAVKHSGAADNEWKVHPQSVPVEALAADAGRTFEHRGAASDQQKIRPQSISVESLAADASRRSEYSGDWRTVQPRLFELKESEGGSAHGDKRWEVHPQITALGESENSSTIVFSRSEVQPQIKATGESENSSTIVSNRSEVQPQVKATGESENESTPVDNRREEQVHVMPSRANYHTQVTASDAGNECRNTLVGEVGGRPAPQSHAVAGSRLDGVQNAAGANTSDPAAFASELPVVSKDAPMVQGAPIDACAQDVAVSGWDFCGMETSGVVCGNTCWWAEVTGEHAQRTSDIRSECNSSGLMASSVECNALDTSSHGNITSSSDRVGTPDVQHDRDSTLSSGSSGRVCVLEQVLRQVQLAPQAGDLYCSSTHQMYALGRSRSRGPVTRVTIGSTLNSRAAWRQRSTGGRLSAAAAAAAATGRSAALSPLLPPLQALVAHQSHTSAQHKEWTEERMCALNTSTTCTAQAVQQLWGLSDDASITPGAADSAPRHPTDYGGGTTTHPTLRQIADNFTSTVSAPVLHMVDFDDGDVGSLLSSSNWLQQQATSPPTRVNSWQLLQAETKVNPWQTCVLTCSDTPNQMQLEHSRSQWKSSRSGSSGCLTPLSAEHNHNQSVRNSGPGSSGCSTPFCLEHHSRHLKYSGLSSSTMHSNVVSGPPGGVLPDDSHVGGYSHSGQLLAESPPPYNVGAAQLQVLVSSAVQASHSNAVQTSLSSAVQPSHSSAVQPSHSSAVQPSHSSAVQPSHSVSVQLPHPTSKNTSSQLPGIAHAKRPGRFHYASWSNSIPHTLDSPDFVAGIADTSAVENLPPMPVVDVSRMPAAVNLPATSAADHTATSAVDHSATSAVNYSATSAVNYSATSAADHIATSAVNHCATSAVNYSASAVDYSATSAVNYSATSAADHTATSAVNHSATSAVNYSATSAVDYSATSAVNHSATSAVDPSATTPMTSHIQLQNPFSSLTRSYSQTQTSVPLTASSHNSPLQHTHVTPGPMAASPHDSPSGHPPPTAPPMTASLHDPPSRQIPTPAAHMAGQLHNPPSRHTHATAAPMTASLHDPPSRHTPTTVAPMTASLHDPPSRHTPTTAAPMTASLHDPPSRHTHTTAARTAGQSHNPPSKQTPTITPPMAALSHKPPLQSNPEASLPLAALLHNSPLEYTPFSTSHSPPPSSNFFPVATALSTILHACGTLGSRPDDAWLAWFMSVMEAQLASFSPRAVVSVLWACAALRHIPSMSWMRHVLHHLRESTATRGQHHILGGAAFTAQGQVVVLWALVKMRMHPGDSWLCQRVLQCSQQLESLAPRHVSVFLWTLCRLLPFGSAQAVSAGWGGGKAKGRTAIHAVCSSLQLRLWPVVDASLPQYGPRELGLLLWSVACLGLQPSRPLLSAAAVKLQALHYNMSAVVATQVLCAYAFYDCMAGISREHQREQQVSTRPSELQRMSHFPTHGTSDNSHTSYSSVNDGGHMDIRTAGAQGSMHSMDQLSRQHIALYPSNPIMDLDDSHCHSPDNVGVGHVSYQPYPHIPSMHDWCDLQLMMLVKALTTFTHMAVQSGRKRALHRQARGKRQQAGRKASPPDAMPAAMMFRVDRSQAATHDRVDVNSMRRLVDGAGFDGPHLGHLRIATPADDGLEGGSKTRAPAAGDGLQDGSKTCPSMVSTAQHGSPSAAGVADGGDEGLEIGTSNGVGLPDSSFRQHILQGVQAHAAVPSGVPDTDKEACTSYVSHSSSPASTKTRMPSAQESAVHEGHAILRMSSSAQESAGYDGHDQMGMRPSAQEGAGHDGCAKLEMRQSAQEGAGHDVQRTCEPFRVKLAHTVFEEVGRRLPHLNGQQVVLVATSAARLSAYMPYMVLPGSFKSSLTVALKAWWPHLSPQQTQAVQHTMQFARLQSAKRRQGGKQDRRGHPVMGASSRCRVLCR